MVNDAELLHELRNMTRTLSLIHKDLRKLNAHLFIITATSSIETLEEKEKAEQSEEEESTT